MDDRQDLKRIDKRIKELEESISNMLATNRIDQSEASELMNALTALRQVRELVVRPD
jgi:hypothetical protein